MRIFRPQPMIGVALTTALLTFFTATPQQTSAMPPEDGMPSGERSELPSASQMQDPGFVIKSSPYSVEETADRFLAVLEEKGLTVFTTIDHAENAVGASLELPPTRVVIFGNPKLGTPLMQCSRTLALDLPQKVLIWQAESGVNLAYNDPAYLSQRHELGDCGVETLEKVTGALNGLTNQAISN